MLKVHKFLKNMDGPQLTKRARITPNLKAIIWDRYIGPGTLKARCPLCNTYELVRNANSGYEAAHVIASRWYTDDKLTVYYAVPSCAACNNECGDTCLLDYLFCRGRIGPLRHVLRTVYAAYREEYPDGERNLVKILDTLYGNKRFAAGGGLINARQIYNIAVAEQARLLADRIETLMGEVRQTTEELNDVVTCTCTWQSH